MSKTLKIIGIFVFVGIVFYLLFLLFQNQICSNTEKIITIIGALTALISVAGTLYNKMLEEENKSKFFELEKKHQISKETYQQLFDKKMALYENLYKIYLQYKKDVQGIGRDIYFNDVEQPYSERITPQKIFNKTFKKIKDEIEKNFLIISQELERYFLPMLDTYEKKENILQHYNDLGVISDEEEAKQENEKLNKKFYKEHKETMNKFWEQLKKEIREIREKIKDH